MLKEKRNPLLKRTYREKSASTGNIKQIEIKRRTLWVADTHCVYLFSVEMCDRSQVTARGEKGRISLKGSKERVNHFKRNTTWAPQWCSIYFRVPHHKSPPQPLKLKTSANVAMHSRKRLNDQGGSRFLCVRKWFFLTLVPKLGILGER